MKVGELLQAGAALLTKSGIESPRLDARVLLSYALRCTWESIAAHPEREAEKTECALYEKALLRRANGESVSVITGKKDFRYITLCVTKDVLVPRPETETLVEAALLELSALKKTRRLQSLSALDLGTGSGNVGLSLKHEAPDVAVTLSDLSEAALHIARENAVRLGLDVRCVYSNLFANIPESFDIIVSNPPYVKEALLPVLAREVQNEPRLALSGGADGLSVIRPLIAQAPRRLNSGGSLLLEAAPEEMAEICELFKQNGFSRVKLWKDLAGSERVIGAQLL